MKLVVSSMHSFSELLFLADILWFIAIELAMLLSCTIDTKIGELEIFMYFVYIFII